MVYAVFSANGLLLLLQFHFQRQMLKVFTSLFFRVKNSHQFMLQKRNCCLFPFSVSWQERDKLCFTEKEPFLCGWLYKILRWIAVCDTGLLMELCIY